ncbi:hypothetical protein ACLB2K_024875 [Fragaria x ananassa]
MSNHYSSFFKGIKSLNMKLNILRYHLTHPQRHLTALVGRFSAMVEGELRQYEDELETIRAKVFQLLKEKTNLFGLRWLPDARKEPVLSVGLKIRGGAMFGLEGSGPLPAFVNLPIITTCTSANDQILC